jgi:hypothetical protein
LQISDVTTIKLPQIDFASLPDLASFSDCDRPTALHGALTDRPRLQSLDDNRAQLLPCLYELHPGT